MSYNWCFHSFDFDAFERALDEARSVIVDHVMKENSELGGYTDAELARYQHVGKIIMDRGFVYDELEPKNAEVMDQFAFGSFHALAKNIEFTAESYEFLSPYVTSDLPSHLTKKHFFSRPKPIPESERQYFLLPLFAHQGRRLGQTEPTPCEYVALSPAEVGAIEKELLQFLTTDDGRALDEANDSNLSHDFLGPVRAALEKGKALHAQLS